MHGFNTVVNAEANDLLGIAVAADVVRARFHHGPLSRVQCSAHTRLRTQE